MLWPNVETYFRLPQGKAYYLICTVDWQDMVHGYGMLQTYRLSPHLLLGAQETRQYPTLTASLWHMRLPFLWAFIPFFLFLSCVEGAKTNEKRPDDILPQEQMATLLQQAHLQEARLQTRRLPAGQAKEMFDKQWDSTVRALGTDTATFTKSLLWYTYHVKDLDAIYERVVDSLGLEESRANGRPIIKRGAQTSAGLDSAARIATPADTGPQLAPH